MATKNKKAKRSKKPSSRAATFKKAKKKAPTKPAKKKAAPPPKSTQTAKRRAAPKKTMAVKKQAAAPPPKSFADKVRDCDAGTRVWFMVAGGIEHAAIQRRGGDGAVVILTDAGVPEVVPSGNLFETADEARAARIR